MITRLVPDSMAGYATSELAEKLTVLTTNQRVAIARMVTHVFIENKPLAELFRGEDRICSESSYYRRGRLDESTGGWAVKPGWGHDKAFQDALSEAARLAIQAHTREEMTALQTAKRRARLAAPGVVDQLVHLSQAADKDAARVAASKVILDYAEVDATRPGDDKATDEANDWWKAAEG